MEAAVHDQGKVHIASLVARQQNFLKRVLMGIRSIQLSLVFRLGKSAHASARTE